MNELQEARGVIEGVDRQMAALFEQRMEAVRQVAAYKRDRGLPVLDEKQEEKVLERNCAYIGDEVIRQYYRKFMQDTMSVSRQYQERLLLGARVAYSGVEGAFAHMAAKKVFPGGRYVPFPSFDDAYLSVVEGECDYAVLPIENSYAEQAEENTAVAAEKAAALGDPSVAAIASEATAELYGLTILDHDINESKSNTTRFAVFARTRSDFAAAREDSSFILLFRVNNVAGALAESIEVIGKHGFNMKALRSRPMKDLSWSCFFYVEAEGDPGSPAGQEMLRELREHCDMLRVAGQYAGV